MIRPVPTWYRGTLFRSTLEADWAATFDRFGWDTWQYEPEALLLSNGKTPNAPWRNGGECLRSGDAKFFRAPRVRPRGAA